MVMGVIQILRAESAAGQALEINWNCIESSREEGATSSGLSSRQLGRRHR